MLIVCPSCATAFKVTRSVLGETGRQVRCAQCRSVWLATPEAAIEEDAAMPMAAAAAASAIPAPPPQPPKDDVVDDADWGAAFAEEAEAKNAAEADFDVMVPQAESPSIQPDADVPALPQRMEEEPDEPDPQPRRLARGGGGDGTPVRRPRRPSLIRRPSMSIRLSPSVAILLLGGAILLTFLLGREHVVRTVPDAAGIYERIGLPVNLRGVEFRDVKGANEIVDGVVVLVVEGQLVNISGRPVDLPRLRLAVRDSGAKEIYTWTATAPKPSLTAGEAVPFRSRLASPPPDGASVEVRFFTRLDAAGR